MAERRRGREGRGGRKEDHELYCNGSDIESRGGDPQSHLETYYFSVHTESGLKV